MGLSLASSRLSYTHLTDEAHLIESKGFNHSLGCCDIALEMR